MSETNKSFEDINENLKTTTICLNCKAIFIGRPDKCSECNHGLFHSTHESNQKYAVNYEQVLKEYRNDNYKFNINEKKYSSLNEMRQSEFDENNEDDYNMNIFKRD